MGIREKILVAMMASVIGYGIYDFTATRIRKGSLASRVAEVKKQTQELVATTRGQLDRTNLTPREKELLERIDQPWQSGMYVNLLHPPPVREPEPQPGELEADTPGAEPVPTYRYTGYMNINGRRLAVINGSEYQDGDTLGSGAFRIRTIEADRVVLERETGNQTLTLKRHEPETFNLSLP